MADEFVSSLTAGAEPPQQNPQEVQPPENEQTPPEQQQPPQEEKKPDGLQTMRDDSRKVLENLQIMPDAVEKEWFDNGGKLSDETYQKFEQAGISRQMVDNYGKMMQQAQSQSAQQAESDFRNEVDKVTGGRENTLQLMQYLTSGAIPAAEQQALYNQIDTGNVTQATAAINRLKVLHEERYGKPGKLLSGNNSTLPPASGDIFQTADEAMLAYKNAGKGDPRQATAQRRVIMEKLKRTNEYRRARNLEPFHTS